MSNLQLSIEEAKALHASGSAKIKKMLEDKFGKKTFQPSRMELIKTWPDACKATGEHPVKSLPYPKPANAEQEAINAFAMLSIIRKALNDGWEPNWADTSQYKYWPWMKYVADKSRPSGFRLSCVGYGDGYSFTLFGSRLCFPSKEVAEHAGKQFSDVYEKMFILPKPSKKTK